MHPRLLDGEFIFCSFPEKDYGDITELKPLASYLEDEGLSLVIEKSQADGAGVPYESTFKGITLSVHSSLNAVGLTAAVASVLAEHGIPANVIAAHFHDHVFVPASQAELALNLLRELGS